MDRYQSKRQSSYQRDDSTQYANNLRGPSYNRRGAECIRSTSSGIRAFGMMDKENVAPASKGPYRQRVCAVDAQSSGLSQEDNLKGLRAAERVGSDNEKFIAPRGSRYEEIEVNHVHAARKERARSNSKERVKRAKARGQPQIDYQKPLKLIQQARHVQVGTIMYSQDLGQAKVQRRFVPIFPFLYDDIKNGACVQQAEFYLPQPSKVEIPLMFGKKNAEKHETNEEGTQPQNLPTKANLRFTMEGDPLFKYEDTRHMSRTAILNKQGLKARYICDLEIINFKSVMIFTQSSNQASSGSEKKARAIEARIYISLHKPSTVYKIYPENEHKPQEVRSPFRHPTSSYINYWNLHQVFYIGGTSFQDSIDRFIEVINARNPLCKIKISTGRFDQTSSEMPINVHIEDLQDGKSRLSNSILTPIRQLMDRSRTFQSLLPCLKLPILFSLLALLSQDKINIFTESIIQLTQYILFESQFNKDEDHAKLAAATIDQIIISEVLNYKKDPNQDLVALFVRHANQITQSISQLPEKSKQDMVNYMKQRRLIITPTIDYYQIEVEDETCLALRKYKEFISRFIRVTFTNESFTRGFYQQHTDGGQSLLLGFIHSILKHGHVIYPSVKETYGQSSDPNIGCMLQFLSYSNSQIKRHSAWFLVKPIEAIDDPISEDIIMDSMGDFSFEKNILKKYARRGQCFSTAKFITQLKKQDIQNGFPDIKRNGYTFTDGCGYVSKYLAEIISKQFNLSLPASAFQIRIGGAKGVLMVAPEEDMAVTTQNEYGDEQVIQYLVRLRDSQIKFNSPDLSLNVVRCATFSQGFLNRQLIVLLSCLGVPDEVFLQFQSEAKEMASVNEIYKRLVTKSNKVVRTFKKKIEKNRDACSQELSALIKFNIGPSKWFQESMKNALLTGYEIQKDPIMSSILYTMQISQLLCLKKKARVLVKDSCVLIGVVDDKGILAPNQIFCQIRHDSLAQSSLKNKKKIRSKSSPSKFDGLKEEGSDESFDIQDDGSRILEGNVLVSRNPCTHPGDVRILEAVDFPEFKHLYNVIVFPSTGLRPLCNMMAGGDLDGDVYFVTWDDRILGNISPRSIYPPAKYSKPDIIHEKPAEESIADYFTFYLERDVLGQLANLHLNMCDFLGPHGPRDPRSIELSGLQSIAVDFAKHGESVPRDQFQDFLKMLKDWPDFFEKNQRKARESKGVLGKLYRELCNEPAYKSYMHNQFTYQVLMRWTLDEKILNKASSKDLLISYLEPVYTKIVQPMERQIRSLMFLFRQHTEAALFASDLKFHISSATTEDIHTSLKFAKADALSGAKPDEALSILNMKLTAMQKTFKGKLRTLIDSLQTEPMDLNIETNVCVALYLASYFHIKNPSCRAFAESCGDNAKLLAFMKAWQADQQVRLSKVKPKTVDRLMKTLNFETYLNEMKVIEESAMSHPRRLQEAIELKKLFAIPWLLATDILCSRNDFFIRVFGAEEVKKRQKAPKPIKVQAPAFFLQSTPTPAVDDQMYCTDASESRQNTPPSLKERSLVEYRGAGEYNPGESMNESMQQLPRVVVVVDNSYEDEDVVMAE